MPHQQPLTRRLLGTADLDKGTSGPFPSRSSQESPAIPGTPSGTPTQIGVCEYQYGLCKYNVSLSFLLTPKCQPKHPLPRYLLAATMLHLNNLPWKRLRSLLAIMLPTANFCSQTQANTHLRRTKYRNPHSQPTLESQVHYCHRAVKPEV